MKTLKRTIKAILPPALTELIRYCMNEDVTWYGNFNSWDEASKKSHGYSSADIANKVLFSTLEVKKGNAKYERDSVLFYDNSLNYELLAAILYAKNKNPEIEIVDFGGALGSLYFQHRDFLKDFDLKWNVVEQERFYEAGKSHVEDLFLKFKKSLEETSPDSLLLMSGVLQYLPAPYAFLESVLKKKYKYIFIDRTGFNVSDVDRLTIQEVPAFIYKASYPCWFFSESKLLDKVKAKYDLRFDFNALDHANIPSNYKGYFFELRA